MRTTNSHKMFTFVYIKCRKCLKMQYFLAIRLIIPTHFYLILPMDFCTGLWQNTAVLYMIEFY